MSITLFGGALLPLCVLLCGSPTGLLMLVHVGSIFGAAAALILGGAGLQPALLPATMFVGYFALQALLGAPMPGARRVLHGLAPLLLLGVYAVASAVILPHVFEGRFAVWPQKPEPPVNMPVLLRPSAANVTQPLYLVMDLALLVAAAIHLAPRPRLLTQLLSAYLACGFVVDAFCLWQLASKLAGVPFPQELLYSNPGWSILADQVFAGVPRISGSFSEPASLSFYLCGTLYACAWLIIRGHRHRLLGPLLLLTVICIAISTSTTGFAVLGIGMVIGLVYGLIVAREMVMRLLRAAAPVLAGLALAAASITTMAPQLTASAAIVAAQTLAKTDTESFTDRTEEDLDSLDLLLPTYGLGIGLGSNRSSSLIPGLVATMGVAGLVCPAWFIWRLREAGHAARYPRTGTPAADEPAARVRMAVDGFAAASLGSLLTAVISAPIIVSAMFYLNLAALVAGLIHLRAIRGWQPAAVVVLGGVMLMAQPVAAAEPAFLAGVATHFAQVPQALDQGLVTLQRGGFGSLRDEIYWPEVEPRAGEFQFSPRWDQMVLDTAAHGLRPLLVLDYGNKFYDRGDKPRSPAAIAGFARYGAAVAGRFRGHGVLYEIWNEWNGRLGNTTPGALGDYLPLLRASSTALREADPDALVLGDGVLYSDGAPGVIEAAIDAGAMYSIDGIALHPYFYNRGHDHRPEAWAAYVAAAEARMRAANHGTVVPLYITETGWPTASTDSVPADNAIGEALQAAYAVRLYLLARSMSFVNGLWWYDLRDDQSEANFGLVRDDFSAKPAFAALAEWLAHTTGAHCEQAWALPAPLAGLIFIGRDGKRFRAIWSTDDQVRSVQIGTQRMVATAMPVFLPGDGP